MKLGLVLGSLLLGVVWPHCCCSAAVQLASGRSVVIGQTDDSVDEVILTVGAPLSSRPWLGCGYDVLAIDFAEGSRPRVRLALTKVDKGPLAGYTFERDGFDLVEAAGEPAESES